VNSLFDFLFHGARLVEKLGTLQLPPPSFPSARKSLSVYLAAPAGQDKRPRVHLEVRQTTLVSFLMVPFHMDREGAASLESALRDGHEARIQGLRLPGFTLPARQELVVEPRVLIDVSPRPTELTFQDFGLLFSYRQLSVTLEADSVRILVGLLERAIALMDQSPFTAAA
jgi:hypothetical protein